MPNFPQVSLFIIFQNIKRFSIISNCNEILNRKYMMIDVRSLPDVLAACDPTVSEEP